MITTLIYFAVPLIGLKKYNELFKVYVFVSVLKDLIHYFTTSLSYFSMQFCYKCTTAFNFFFFFSFCINLFIQHLQDLKRALDFG